VNLTFSLLCETYLTVAMLASRLFAAKVCHCV